MGLVLIEPGGEVSTISSNLHFSSFKEVPMDGSWAVWRILGILSVEPELSEQGMEMFHAAAKQGICLEISFESTVQGLCEGDNKKPT